MEYLEGETLAERLAKGAAAARADAALRDGDRRRAGQGAPAGDRAPGPEARQRDADEVGREAARLRTGQGDGAGLSRSRSLTALPTQQGLTRGRARSSGPSSTWRPSSSRARRPTRGPTSSRSGRVLYEMATGKKAFSGTSQASLISAIMSADPPPISSVQPMSPPALDRVVKTCLAKDPEERWQTRRATSGESCSWIAEGSAAGRRAPSPSPRQGPRAARLDRRSPLAAAAAFVVGFLYLRRKPEPVRVFRSSILPPEKTQFAFQRLAAGGLAGRAPHRLQRRPSECPGPALGPVVRGLRSASRFRAPREVTAPFWSPDSRFLGFFADGKLKKIDVSGGTPQTLCDAPNGGGGTWSRDGVILFAPSDGPLHRVADSGGASSPVTRVDEEHGDIGHIWPIFLPDGRHFLYLRYLGRGRARQEPYGLFLRSLDSKEERLLLRVRANVAYSPAPDGSSAGYLLYLQARILVARPFDARRLEFTGEAFPIAEQVQLFGASSTAVFSVSAERAAGLPVGRRGRTLGARLVRPRRKTSRVSGRAGELHSSAALPRRPAGRRRRRRATDGQHGPLALRPRARRDRHDSRSGPPSTSFRSGPRTTRGSSSLPTEGGCTTSTRGSRPARAGTSSSSIRRRASDSPTDWSPEGHIAFQFRDTKAKTGLDVGVVSVADRKAVTLLGTPFDEWTPQFSPDGRWLAYASDESGRSEVYVQPFPGPGGSGRSRPAAAPIRDGGGTGRRSSSSSSPRRCSWPPT